MTDKELADLICRALLAIVAALRRKYDLPDYRGITVNITSIDNVTPPPQYK